METDLAQYLNLTRRQRISPHSPIRSTKLAVIWKWPDNSKTATGEPNSNPASRTTQETGFRNWRKKIDSLFNYWRKMALDSYSEYQKGFESEKVFILQYIEKAESFKHDRDLEILKNTLTQ